MNVLGLISQLIIIETLRLTVLSQHFEPREEQEQEEEGFDVSL
jgi:hypothetical protein